MGRTRRRGICAVNSPRVDKKSRPIAGGRGEVRPKQSALNALDELLAREVAEGEKLDSGKFTLARDKALEKLSGYQLPGEADWVLKVIQAAVAGGFRQINVRLSGGGVEFGLAGECAWTLSDLQQGFYDPQTSADRSLQHLKQALWSACLQGRRPFHLSSPGWDESLFWNGESMRRQVGVATPETRLTISHRAREGIFSYRLLRDVESARRNSEILQTLRNRAFVCPVPLRVDARRLDALQHCPDHGLSSSSYPLRFAFSVGGDLPPFKMPPLTRGGYDIPHNANVALLNLVERHLQVPDECALVAILTAHARDVQWGKSTSWQPYEQTSRIYWVSDGVVIDCRAFAVAPGSCSLGLVASAQGLTTDLSGLALQVNQVYRGRLSEICRMAHSFLETSQLRTDQIVTSPTPDGRLAGAALLLGGLGLSFINPIFGGVVAAGGLTTFLGGPGETEKLARSLVDSHEQLGEEWARAHARKKRFLTGRKCSAVGEIVP